jgi:hypothetical protein
MLLIAFVKGFLLFKWIILIFFYFYLLLSFCYLLLIAIDYSWGFMLRWGREFEIFFVLRGLIKMAEIDIGRV